MSKHLDQHELRKYLWAFADGELDVEQNLKVLEQLAIAPKTTRRVIHQQQLRRRVACVAAEPRQAPSAVREQIADLVRRGAGAPPQGGEAASMADGAGAAANHETSGPVHPTSLSTRLPPRGASAPPAGGPDREASSHPAILGRIGRIGRIGRWAPLAVAAVLLIGVVLVARLGFPSAPATPWANPNATATGPRATPGTSAAINTGIGAVLPVSLVRQLEIHHVRCDHRQQMRLAQTQLPTRFKALPGALSRYFDKPVTAREIDLKGAGFAYELAGICAIPARQAVHLRYHRRGPNGRSYQEISLWLTADDGQHPDLRPDHLYVAADQNQPCPVLVWRARGLVYYLVGDSMPDLQQAAQVLGARG